MIEKKVSNFACQCGCGFNNTSLDFIDIILGIEKKYACCIIVTSGCRCREHNKIIGGKDDSRHTYGDASDLTCIPVAILKVIAQDLDENWEGGFHYYPEKNIIHIDRGDKRRW